MCCSLRFIAVPLKISKVPSHEDLKVLPGFTLIAVVLPLREIAIAHPSLIRKVGDDGEASVLDPLHH
jgi:hypothetical protein